MLKRLLRFSGFKLGLLLTVFFAIVAYELSDNMVLKFIANIENSWLDWKFLMRGGPRSNVEREEFQKKSHVVIVAIDEESLRKKELGMWPWPREKTAKLVEELTQCGAKVIGFDMIFSEPDRYRLAPVVKQIRDRYAFSSTKDPAFEKDLDDILTRVDGDSKFANVLENLSNVVLGFFFFRDEEQIQELDPGDLKTAEELMSFGVVEQVRGVDNSNLQLEIEESLYSTVAIRANLPILSEAVNFFGYFNMAPDSDGSYRQVPLVMGYKEKVYPSLSLRVLSRYYEKPIFLFLNYDGKKFEFNCGRMELFISGSEKPSRADADIPVGPKALYHVNYYGPQKTFKHISASDIILGSAENQEKYAAACAAINGKVALIGVTSIGIYDHRKNPFDATYPGVEIHSTVIENAITKNFMQRPIESEKFEALGILVLGIFLSWFLNRYRLTRGLLVSILFCLGLAAVDYQLLFKRGLLAHIVLPEIYLVVLFVGIAVYRYATEERKKREIRHAFQFYLSKDFIDIVLKDTNKLKLGGERRELTVLFSDIRGFTTISERLAPEALTEFLNEYLTPMTDLVFKNKGTLDKYMGDAVMAFYGAPVPFDDHPRAACQTALDMMDDLHRLQKGWRERGLPEIDIGIGINTGSMSVGNMGSFNRFDYTVMGDNVNLGSRLEGLNKQYGTHILISEFTQEKVVGLFTCRELDAVLVKGKLKPIRIFELLHQGPPDREKDAWIDTFNLGLTAYKDRKWEVAISTFQLLREDHVSQMYIDRCQQMRQNPPGPEWDGVFKMTTK